MIIPFIRMLRPRQWIKNVLVFAGIIFSQNYHDAASWLVSLEMFIAFSLVASAIYIINDICDAPLDRLHPVKKYRPIATGEIDPRFGGMLAVILLVVGLTWSWKIDSWVFQIMVGYTVMMIAYSLLLKKILLMDVFIIAIGFMMRPMAGAAAIGVIISKWLMICAFFIGLTLALIKRRQELARLEGDAEKGRASLWDAPPLQIWDHWIMMISAVTVVGYTLYTIDPITVAHVGSQKLLYTTPVVVFALFRYHVQSYARGSGEDPTEVVLSDPWILFSIVAWIAVVMFVFMGWI
ncbi:MAG: decaprenyl-phosphate phosphoribosyltransferase [bacterium]